MKCSQDEYNANVMESKKRPRRYTERNGSSESSSKKCETSFENKRRKLDTVMTRGSPATDLPKKRSSNSFQNVFKMYCESETETSPRKSKASPAKNDQSPIILSQIAEKVKLCKRKTVVSSEHSYSKVTDIHSRIKYSKRKKRKKENLTSPCALKSAKESEFRKNIKNVPKEPIEIAGTDSVKKATNKETKSVYAKKARALRIRKKYSRPRLVTPDKKINRIESETAAVKPPAMKIKEADEVSKERRISDSVRVDKSPAKDETCRNRKRKWSLGKLPLKKKKIREKKEKVGNDDKNPMAIEKFASVRSSMKKRNAALMEMNSEPLLPDEKEASDDCDDENCYDRQEIMTLLLNLTRTINEMSSLDGPAQLKKLRAKKPKTLKAQSKTHTDVRKPENHKNLKALLASPPKNFSDSHDLEIRNSEVNINNENQNTVNALPTIDSSRNDFSTLVEEVDDRSRVVDQGSRSTRSGENDEARKSPRPFRYRKKNNGDPFEARNESETENSGLHEPSLCDRSVKRGEKELNGSNAEISKDIFLTDLSTDAVERSAESVEDSSKGKDAEVKTLPNEENLSDRPIRRNDSNADEAVEALCSASTSREEKKDGENSSPDEEREKQLSLVKFLRSSIGISQRIDEDDKDTVIFNLSDVTRSLPPDASHLSLRKRKSSVKIDKLRRLKVERLRKKRKMYENRKCKRKAKFKRRPLKKASSRTTNNVEASEKSTPAKNPDFIKTLKEVSNLIKKLHESHQIILFLEKDMASKPELSDHFKLVISAQYANYRNNISEYKSIIMEGIDKMSEILSKKTFVTAEISKEARLSEEEVSNVISRCVLAEDVPEQNPKDSGGDGLSVSDAEAVREIPNASTVDNTSTGASAASSRSSSQENNQTTAFDFSSSSSFEIPDSGTVTDFDTGLFDIGKTAPKILSVNDSSSDKDFTRKDKTQKENFTIGDPSTPPSFSSASNGISGTLPVTGKGKSPPTKSVGLRNHPFKISMTKSGLCLRLGDGPGGFVPLETTQSLIHRVATSYLRNTVRVQAKTNGKESTEERLSRLPEPAANVSVNRSAPDSTDVPQKEPSKFLQGFVREFVGPLRHSVILPGTKSIPVSDDKLASAPSRFSEPSGTKQTPTQVFVMKLKDPQVYQIHQKARTNPDLETAFSMTSRTDAAKEVQDREILIAKARNTLQAALIKAGEATQAKMLEKRTALPTGFKTRNQAFNAADSQTASSSIATETNVEPNHRTNLFTSEKTGRVPSISSEEKRSPSSKTSNEDVSRTSPDTQKKAMAQLIELSKRLVETRSLLRQSGKFTGCSASNPAIPQKSDPPSGALPNGHAAGDLAKSLAPSSEPPTGGHRLLETDASPFPDAKASTTIGLRRSERLNVASPAAKASTTTSLRRSKRFQARNVSPEPSTSNASLASFRKEQEGKEKESPGKRAAVHSTVSFIKVERESEEGIGDAYFISQEDSSCGENQSDEEDVYFDMEKVKKELEDVHGLIHFICAENKCMNPGTEICTGCQSVLYCGRQCQARHWNRKHYKHCEELKKMADERKKSKVAEN